VSALPASSNTVCLFFGMLLASGSGGSVHHAKSSIALHHRAEGLPDPTNGMVQDVAKSTYEKWHKHLRNPRQRVALPGSAIIRFSKTKPAALSDHEWELATSVVIVGTRLLLRRSEVSNADCGHVGAFSQSIVELDPGFTKTDKLGLHGALKIDRSMNGEASTCPYQVLLRWFRKRVAMKARKKDPLFCWEDGTRITSEDVSDMVKLVALHSQLDIPVSGHSLRITGATLLALSGMPFDRIQAIGRWRSATHLTYIRDLSVNRESVNTWKKGTSTAMGF
jgi:hypothetical protein